MITAVDQLALQGGFLRPPEFHEAAVKGGDLYGPFPTVGIDKAASGFTVNGQRPNSNNMTIDGITNIVDVYVRQLRAKIDEPFGKKLIRTVRSVGYALSDSNEE